MAEIVIFLASIFETNKTIQMKKILLLFLVSIFSIGAFAFKPDASLQSKINGKTYFFDFSAKKYLRYNPATNQIEGTFDMSYFCSNWDAKVGDMTPTAVFQSPDGSKVYFLDTRKDKYLRHDWSNSSIDFGWPKALSSFDSGWPSDWNGTGNNKVDGAFFNNENGRLYLFDFINKKYIKYEWLTDAWTSTTETSVFGNYASVDVNLKYANFASYDSNSNKAKFYKPSTLSYIAYSWSAGGFSGPSAMTKLGNWSDDWSTGVYNGTCTTYYMQGNGGHRMLPLKVDLPEGIYGTDYKLKNLQLNVESHSNDSIGIILRSPQEGGSISRVLFDYFDATGVDIGNGCSNPASFNDEGDSNISGGTAPYTNGDGIEPDENFSSIPNGTVYNGYWYVDIYSKSKKANSDEFKKFLLEFEPIRTLNCNTSETYSAPAGDGVWDMSSVCGTPEGMERVYKFIPTISGEHFILLEGGSGYHDYYIKNGSLGLNGNDWICPTSIGPDEYSLGDLSTGEVYYIMAKPEANTGTSSTFNVSCPSCPVPYNLSEDGIGYTELDFTWDEPAGVTSFVWQLKQGGLIVDNGTAANGVSLHVDGLQPGQAYTLEVKSECGGGLYSAPVSLTLSTYDCSNPTNLSANAAVSDITYHWTHAPLTHNYSWQISGGGFTNSGTTTSNTVTVSGLAAATNYTFQIKTKCGASLFSDAATITTSTGSASCDPPVNLANDNGSYTSLGFVWDDSPSATNYVWHINQGATVIQTGTTNDGGQFSVNDLLPGETYTFFVKTDCGGGLYSSEISTTGTTLACNAPTGLVASDITPTGFNVSIDAGSSLFKKWQVVPAGNGMNNGIVAGGEINSSVFSATGLNSGSPYDFYVRAKCGDLYSDAASLLNVNTLVGIEELTNITGLNIYPNPTKDVLNIAIKSVQSTVLEISVVNLLGKIVLEKNTQLNNETHLERLDVSMLTSGSYFIKIADKGKTASFLFVKE